MEHAAWYRRMAARARILIVEDNSDLRRLYALGLNQRGFEVKLASNGAEAVDRVETERPELVLLDLFMPIMDGFEVMERINPPGQAMIPIIIVSGEASPPEELPHASIAAWMAKPVAIEELVQAIRNVLRGAA